MWSGDESKDNGANNSPMVNQASGFYGAKQRMYWGLFQFGYLVDVRSELRVGPYGLGKDYNLRRANVGNLQNIYLNFNFLEQVFTNNTGENGEVKLFNILQDICKGINTAMGSINKLEPIINEETNTLSIIDTTPIPGRVKQWKSLDENYLLNLFGYKGNTNESNFVNYRF